MTLSVEREELARQLDSRGLGEIASVLRTCPPGSAEERSALEGAAGSSNVESYLRRRIHAALAHGLTG